MRHVLRDTCCYAQTVGNTPTLPLKFCKSARPCSFSPSFNHIVRSPSNSANQRNLTLASGFVKMSAGFSSVGMYWTNNFSSSTASHMKWYRTSICLVREWYLLSLPASTFVTKNEKIWRRAVEVGCELSVSSIGTLSNELAAGWAGMLSDFGSSKSFQTKSNEKNEQ